MMKKTIFLLVLFSLIIGCISSVSAEKKVDNEKTKLPNIYSWGSFDSPEDLKKIEFTRGTGGYAERAGVNGSGCAKITTNAAFGSISIPAPLVIGETYDISFDYKTDAAPAKMSLYIQYDDGGYHFISSKGKFTNDWSHFQMTYTHTGKNDAGNDSEKGTGYLNIRYNEGQELITYYIDNFSFVPHGDVEGNYDSLIISKQENLAEDEENITERKKIEFSDMSDHWAKDCVNTFATYNYLSGVGDNKFNPDAEITRAEFIKMVANSYQVMLPEYNGEFSDVDGDKWYAKYIALADKLHLLDRALTIGGKLKPDEPITREEAATIVANAASYKNAELIYPKTLFTDDSEISNWAKQAIYNAVSYGLIKGYNNEYRPKNHMTRAEAAQILMRLVEIDRRFNIYVDADKGDDKNNGTIDAPLKTLYAARDMVRKYNAEMQNDITVYIRGEHYLDKTFKMNEEDSGNHGYNVIYTSWGETKPTFSMGKKYTGFELCDKEKNIYRVYVGNGTQTRQAYFNNNRRTRANNFFGLKNCEYDAETKTYISEDTELLTFQYPTDVEIVWVAGWMDVRLNIDSVEDLGGGKVRITPNTEHIDQMEHAFELIKKVPIPNDPMWLENAYEFLDTPGEWYMNEYDGFMYYIPIDGENMETMELTLPKGEEMISAKGTSEKQYIHNIIFDNIEFANTGWLAPTKDRYVGNMQNHMYGGNNLKAIMPCVAVSFQNARYVNVQNCDFARMGSVALAMDKAIQHCNITGNEFYDIAGGALFMGTPADDHLFYEKDKYNEYNTVTNNYIHNIGLDYRGSAGMSTGFVRNCKINHNDCANLPYSAVHIGWGWGIPAQTGTNLFNVEVGYNYVREVMADKIYDGGAIYVVCPTMLDAPVQNKMIGNYIVNVRNAYTALYVDNGSTHWDLCKNVVDFRDVPKWEFAWDQVYEKDELRYASVNVIAGYYSKIYDNYYTTNPNAITFWDYIDYQEGVYQPDGNWDDNARAIIENAGVEPEYESNFDFEEERTLVLRLRKYTMLKDESQKIDLKIVDRNQKEYSLSDYDIKYYSSDPEILTVDSEGVMHSKGDRLATAWVEIVANINGRLQSKTVKVLVNESLDKIQLNVNAINIIQGYTAKITASAKMASGATESIPIQNMTFDVEDPTVVTIDEDGVVTGIGIGQTSIKVTATSKGITKEFNIPAKIINYSQPDSLSLPYEMASSEFFNGHNWKIPIKKNKNGLPVSGMPNYYIKETTKGKLIAFDMTINEPGGWPSIALCATDTEQDYSNGSAYLIGFKSTYLEMQRFNNGVRTMIFGDKSMSPVGGPGIPNTEDNKLYEYGKKMSIIVGAMEEDDGTRIVLTINGKNILDYVDTDENALFADGYFGVYIPGDFTISPYTGITE